MPDSHSQVVAANVRAAAARKRASQSDLGRVLGVSQAAVSRRLLGRMSFRVDELRLLAEYLDAPIESLMADEVVAS